MFQQRNSVTKLLAVPTAESSSQRTTAYVQNSSTKATHIHTPCVSEVGFFLTTADHFRSFLPSAWACGVLTCSHHE